MARHRTLHSAFRISNRQGRNPGNLSAERRNARAIKNRPHAAATAAVCHPLALRISSHRGSGVIRFQSYNLPPFTTRNRTLLPANQAVCPQPVLVPQPSAARSKVLATRAIAWCLKPVRPFPRKLCSSSTARRAAKSSPPSYFCAPMARRGCVRSQASGRCPSILPTLHLTRVRTRASKRCAGTSRPHSPPRRSKRAKRVSGRSLRNGLLIGALPGIDGAYVATGHSVWGMLNAPATGEAMSELILNGAARRVDLAPFAPGRLPPLDPARLRSASS
jgi:hypothetical protein